MWKPFSLVENTNLKLSVYELTLKFDITREQAEAYIESSKNQRVYINNVYQVILRDCGDIVHLSIKRLDKEAKHDWRQFQRIKNELVGEECEAIELYPAESRKVDTANQYHLWVFKDPNYRIPLGFSEGLVSDTMADNTDAKQRKFNDED